MKFYRHANTFDNFDDVVEYVKRFNKLKTISSETAIRNYDLDEKKYFIVEVSATLEDDVEIIW